MPTFRVNFAIDPHEPFPLLGELAEVEADDPLEVGQFRAKESAMLALWINTKEQRSEGSFAGQPANTLPAQPLRC